MYNRLTQTEIRDLIKTQKKKKLKKKKKEEEEEEEEELRVID